jgi:rRNA maturation protein Nop10
MGMQGGNAGLIMPVRYVFKPPAGTFVLAGFDAQGYPFSYTPGATTVWVFKAGAWLLPEDYTAADGAQIVLKDPTGGEEYSVFAVQPFQPADTYSRGQLDQMINRRRNRFVDPGVRISQENGTNVIPLTTTAATYYVTDNCAVTRNTAAGMMTAQQVKSYTPGGSGYRNRFTCTTANPNPAAGDACQVMFPIEGRDIADLRFGTNGAKSVLKRIGINSSVSGDIILTVRNRGNTRSWVGKLTVEPGNVGKDIFRWVWFVGDQSGAWDDDTNLGMVMTVCLCAGSNYQGVPGWQNGAFVGMAGGINFMAAVGMTLDLFDIGSHDVSDITNPAPPRFELSDWQDDYRRCKRYMQKSYRYEVLPGSGADASTEAVIGVAISAVDMYDYGARRFEVDMRSSPAMVGYNPITGTPGTYYDFSLATPAPNGNVNFISATAKGFRVNNSSQSWQVNHVVAACWVAYSRLL